ncbi:MAG: hypothetical protein AABX71_00140 [Nanoarchaeota archaeon]
MENVHVKLEIGESISSKKNLLSAEINLLNIIKNLEKYRKARDIELKKKSRLRTELKKLIADMRALEKNLPETRDIKRSKEGKIKMELIGKVKSAKLEFELEEIKRKLEMLS